MPRDGCHAPVPGDRTRQPALNVSGKYRRTQAGGWQWGLMAPQRTDVHELLTPRSMSRTGLVGHVWCKAYRHPRDADLAALIAAGRGDVPLVRIRWRCGNCRSRPTDFVVSGSHLRPQS
jgi:hypothetical protein